MTYLIGLVIELQLETIGALELNPFLDRNLVIKFIFVHCEGHYIIRFLNKIRVAILPSPVEVLGHLEYLFQIFGNLFPDIDLTKITLSNQISSRHRCVELTTLIIKIMI